MTFNLPQYTTDNITFGPAIVRLGPVGTTPTADVGAIEGNVEVVVTKEVLEVFQGSPQVLIIQYVTVQGLTVRFTALEALGKLSVLRYALGAGEYSGTPGVGVETLDFGGDVNMAELAAQIFHQMPNGTSIFFNVWRAQGRADTTVTFNKTGISGTPIELQALDGQTDFTGTAIPTTSKGRIFRLVKKNAP